MPFNLFMIDLRYPLGPELSVQSPIQKSWDLNGHTLLCMFLANDFSGCLIFPASHCMCIIVDFQH